ncbi:MAG: glycosyltransferase family 9 protein [Chloroflexi bacterium]|nr:glycosyltransferase family 9 protein [Chloroflexota bacterium]
MDTRWRQASRILAIRLDSLGDVLLTTPAIHAIKKTLPRAHLTLLASPIGAQVGRLCPDVDDVIVYNASWMDPHRLLPQDSDREMSAIRALKERSFGGAIIFTTYRQSPLPTAYLCYLADIPLRLGGTADGAGSLLTTRHKLPPDPLHEVERGLNLVAAIGVVTNETDLVLHVGQDDVDLIRSELSRRGVDDASPVAIVHPGCNFQARTYPWRSYVGVADLLVERLGCQVVFTGSPDERPLINTIRSWMKQDAISLAGETDLKCLAALIKAADIVVTNNTGPAHVAAAMKTPVVVLFALTNPPWQWGPWMVRHRLLNKPVPCSYCYNRTCPTGHECLALVTPDEVVAAARELLDESAGLREERC